ncbi:MAG: triphosphoribosyl-dephospho-CoA synthase [Planctomycetaceae bacterium]|nr:triphosphoribosyl-dephospho-CoA synthase [Planctomycetaceae bacterium]MCB9953720.1 triphosphoribosyl-dephospho-CoA synthase [Planctomycetaceae bacterium]
MTSVDWTLPDLSTLCGQLEAACLLEAAAPKAGNVHPGASFADLDFSDFVASARVVAPILARAGEVGVGTTIRLAAEATQKQVGKNTNLGILLLLAPLAVVPLSQDLTTGIKSVLDALTVEDSRDVFAAIRCLTPGGMGKVDEQDVFQEPTEPLVDIMQLAADRDSIARQYVTGFHDVLSFGVDSLIRWTESGADWRTAIVGSQLDWLAAHPDTLIARKAGAELALQASHQAKAVLASGWPHAEGSGLQFGAFDAWLRSDGHKRNPGTTADLIAASVFVMLRDGHWTAGYLAMN